MAGDFERDFSGELVLRGEVANSRESGIGLGGVVHLVAVGEERHCDFVGVERTDTGGGLLLLFERTDSFDDVATVGERPAVVFCVVRGVSAFPGELLDPGVGGGDPISTLACIVSNA